MDNPLLDRMSDDDFKREFAAAILPTLKARSPRIADKVADMLFDTDRETLTSLLSNFNLLQRWIDEAVKVCEYPRDKAFECGICSEDRDKGAPYVSVAGDPICRDCYLAELKPKFEAALNDEDRYPVPWGNTILDPTDFPEFEEGFFEKWLAQERIYNTPKKERLYCKHLYIKESAGDVKHSVPPSFYEDQRRHDDMEVGRCLHFIGCLTETKGPSSEVVCDDCQGVSCGNCGHVLRPLEGDPYGKHVCDPSKVGEEEEIDPTLVKGIDYQVCPKETCGKKYGLQDGCNVMICACRTHFCYVCGARAHHDSDHWAPGKPCPRWNQPGTQAAQHDHEEAPLVIPELYRAQADAFRRQAAADPPECVNFREYRMDQATCWELRGICVARVERREQQDNDPDAHVLFDVSWVARLETILHLIFEGLHIYIWRNSYPSVDTEEAASEFLNDVELWKGLRADVVKQIAEFREVEPAVFDLLPELDPLVQRYLDMSAKEIQELDEMAVAVRARLGM